MDRYIKLKFSDLHTHTYYSFDSKAEPEAVVLSAIDKGLDCVAITDHLDVDFVDCGMSVDTRYDERKQIILDLKHKYRDKVKVIYGIELGQPYSYRELADKLVKENGYEYILGSVHNLKDVPDFAFFDFKKVNDYPEIVDNLYKRYLADLQKLADIPYIDTVTHVTYVLRYIQAAGGDLDLSRYYGEYEKLFAAIIKNGKSLEINTSNLRRGFGTTMPGEDLIKLYAEMGGKLITVGSDAHRVHEIGANLEDGYKLAEKYGLKPIEEIKELYI